MTKYMQPINPIRVYQAGETANYIHQVFAIGITKSDYLTEVTFMTVNGMIMPKSNIMYAEVLIEGKWTAIDVHRHSQIVDN